MTSIVEFPSQGAMLRGRLQTHAGAAIPEPIVIMAHGFSATISGMVADDYADALHAAGFAVLLFDHRNFGISDGEPRQQINKWVQARGYRDAIDFACSLPGIDDTRIALWGDSLSAAAVMGAAAVDHRVKAIVAQVPAFGDAPPPDDPDGALFAAFRHTLLDGDVSATTETTTPRMPVVSCDQDGTPSLLAPMTAFRWFIEYGGRHGTQWQNWATLVIPATPAPFHPVLCAPHIQAALMLVVASEDEMEGADPVVARMAWERAPEPKELVELGGGHFGLLHFPSPEFDRASRLQCEFLSRQLL